MKPGTGLRRSPSAGRPCTAAMKLSICSGRATKAARPAARRIDPVIGWSAIDLHHVVLLFQFVDDQLVAACWTSIACRSRRTAWRRSSARRPSCASAGPRWRSSAPARIRPASRGRRTGSPPCPARRSRPRPGRFPPAVRVPRVRPSTGCGRMPNCFSARSASALKGSIVAHVESILLPAEALNSLSIESRFSLRLDVVLGHLRR